MKQYARKPIYTDSTILPGYWRGPVLLLCVFILMLILGMICVPMAQSLFPAGSREGILAGSVTQNIIVFFGAALLSSFFLSRQPLQWLGLRGRLRSVTVFNIVMCIILAFPFLNETIWLNSQMHFPSWAAAVEEWMRSLESSASVQVDKLLGVSSVGGLAVNILIIGVLTGFCEEIFFRGALQKTLGSHGVNPHLAIWTAAAIFSLMHFQFFGFLPRLLLGAFFGYVFFWTGSIWACATAHAIFNTITVVESWLVHRGVNATVIETFGVQKHTFPWIACLSLALVLLYIYVQRRNRF